MTKEKQLIAIAKLDGKSLKLDSYSPKQRVFFLERFCLDNPYLTSRDAIIPVIEKHVYNQKQRTLFLFHLGNSITRDKDINKMDNDSMCMFILTAPASQLAEALLRATGKWEE